jgi:hypothetical protein
MKSFHSGGFDPVKPANIRLIWLVSIIAIATLIRLLPMPVNFSPIGAMALFAGFTFRNRIAAFAFPLVALLISDALIGFHDLMWAVYGAFALVVAAGIFLRDQKSVAAKLGGALFASVSFFVITNYAVWMQGSLYPRTQEGLAQCFMAAIPFFKNEVAGDVFFTAVLFGTWALVTRAMPAVEERA